MIYIAICDDDKLASEKIRKMVLAFFRRKNIETEILLFPDGEELLLHNKRLDILFLDIRMKGMDGIETAHKLRSRQFNGFLIFTTVLEEMVFASFEVQAYDYLVKPVDEGKLEKTMERLLTSMQNSAEAKLLLKKGTESSLIPFDDIIYCEIIDRKVYLHLISHEVMDYYDRMEKLETKLDGRFFKCHRSYLINLKYLKSYKDGVAYMENGIRIPVSRLRSKEFSNVILQYMKEWRW